MCTVPPDSASFRAIDLHRYSCGERPDRMAGRPVWKFDAWLRSGRYGFAQTTCYIRLPDKGEALRALFDQCPGAKIYGTGLPLTGEQVLREIGKPMNDGEILLVA